MRPRMTYGRWMRRAPTRWQTGSAVTRSAFLDDHSRFVVGLTPLLRLQTGAVRAALIRSFEGYGVPAAMLMDHGAPWWTRQGPAG